MKRMMWLIPLMAAFMFSCSPKETGSGIPASIYEFQVSGLDSGTTIDFSEFKGKKILIVNTASKCGFTPQYAQLEKLYETHKDKLVVVGFPANNFLWQTPGNGKEIRSFCTKNYGVTFPMAAKISVKGHHKAPIYQWLTEKRYNHFKNNSVHWNFQKYLIDEKGRLIAIFPPSTEPMSKEVLDAIEK